ncbi:GAF and ANTAR domain-containing protein [Pedococcus sp. 5OH_020]|uniref:GAF and ANTAR domain-containing protein n=1 Tax=Pedococcus sp. 5OH_020 TaxID=2989814 RepID=UPI0022E99CFD|nr:GAF and ANTAR domain-containing protein [Pedococcus sp. 5OH_020]
MQSSLVRSFAEAIRHVMASEDLATTLSTIVEATRGSLPGADHVGISVPHGDGSVETVVATDPFVRRLDELQYDLGEGPCLEALSSQNPTRIVDARQEDRWPRFIPKAVDLGLRSQLGVPLHLDGQTLGGLNLYATRVGAFTEETARLMELFSAHAAAAMGVARKVEDLYAALATRKVIGTAIGIVMERYELDEQRAFQYLTRVSQTSNTKVRDLAAELVANANDRNGLPADRPREQDDPEL